MMNYAGNFGGPGMIQACNGTIIPVKGNLIFGLMGLLGSTPPASAGPVRIAAITDGTSNTALFSEHLLAMGNGVFAPPDPSVSPGSSNGKRGIFQISFNVVLDQGNASNAQTFVAACKTVPAGTLAITDDAFGAQWLLSMDYAVANNGYTHFMTPNGISCIGNSAFGISDGSWGGVGAAITATSNHPGGVNVCFSDGSVRFVKDSVNLQTWWALGTRNGGEVVSADQY
jgi:prepilin-type processing-associated H-X9-DG protein